MLLIKNRTIFYVLVCALMINIIYGCSSEDDDIEPVELIDISPKFEVYLNNTITLMFNAKPDIVIVNDIIMPEIQYSYNEKNKIGFYYVDFNISRFVSEPGQVTLTVTWIDSAGTKSSNSLYYKVYKPCCPLEFLESEPKNDEVDVNPEKVNKEGIRLKFSDPIYVEKLNVHIIADNEELKWGVAWKDPMSQYLILLYPLTHPLKSNELGYNQKVIVRLENVMDQAGKLYEPDGTLELHFTTAEEDR